MPLQATSGAASYDAFGGGAAAVPNYIEEVFSTYLYTGNGTTQTITNGIDLSTKGGLVWSKNRTSTTAGTNRNRLHDSARGVTITLVSNSTAAQDNLGSASISSFNTNGYSLGGDSFNNASDPWVSWSFRKQPKFFDIATWTGTGVNRTISHNLGSVPGSIIVKRTDASQDWAVYHRSLANTQYLVLNSTASAATDATWWNSTTPTSTVFSVGTDASVNASGGTYVAYLFAHDAGGFGLTGTDNVISCGSFTTDATTGNATVNLGYEPQWILTKRVSDSGNDWTIFDSMRGMSLTNSYELFPNSTSSEANFGSPDIFPSATGFSIDYISGSGQFGKNKTIIYIAIRRGPMAVPTDATTVFKPVAQTASTNSVVTTGFPVDLSMSFTRDGGVGTSFFDRLRGSSTTSSVLLTASSTAAESSFSSYGIGLQSNTTIVDNYNAPLVAAGPFIYWNFKRAPSFFDEVCYTGTGSATTLSHNLGVAPELMIVKIRDAAVSWIVYNAPRGESYRIFLNTTGAEFSTNPQLYWGNGTIAVAPTSSVFSIGSGSNLVNQTGKLYVAYLFATCVGVSKVGSYTGNGTTQTINCGFTGGARFVLIKRTDSTGGWYVYDTARGMTVLTDPYMLLNSTASDSSTLGSVTTVSTGFALNSTILADINVSAGTYIFLAIA
jgi:hypothetical protein